MDNYKDEYYSDILTYMENAIKLGLSFNAYSKDHCGTPYYIRDKKRTIAKNIEDENFSKQFVSRYNKIMSDYDNTDITTTTPKEISIEDVKSNVKHSTTADIENENINILTGNLKEVLVDKKINFDDYDIKAISSWGNVENPFISLKYQHKPFEDRESVRESIEDFINSKYTYKPLFRDVKPLVGNGMLAVFTIFDVHYGKVAFIGESGEEYNLEIASKNQRNVIEAFMSELKRYPEVDRILFILGNDLFNSDTVQNTTTAGTPQFEDTYWKETIDFVIKDFVDIFSSIGENYKMDVLTVSGNHDRQRSYWLGHVLKGYFYNHPNVDIDYDGLHQMNRRYYKFGKNALGFSHGDGENHKTIPEIFDLNMKKYIEKWHECEYRYHFMGHLHNKKTFPLQQIGNVEVRIVPSVSGTDSWHDLKGYLLARKEAQLFIFDKEMGLRNTLNIYIQNDNKDGLHKVKER